jgi:hypothetical protein
MNSAATANAQPPKGQFKEDGKVKKFGKDPK